MRLGVIGSGWVGLVTGACLAETGNHVTAADVDAEKVRRLNAGECPIFEPGLQELIRANLAAGRLSFTTSTAEAVADASVVFLTVGTPPLPDGSSDLSHIFSAARDAAVSLRDGAVVVVKSTVPVGTCAAIEVEIARHTNRRFHVVSNPEFLKEGSAVDDFLRPDRIVIGADDRAAGELVAELHKPFVRNNKPILILSRGASELAKYAANAYLATRISFINEIAALCEEVGVNVDEVRRGIGADARIGHHFMYPGVGYGGSCFPKDVQALVSTARRFGIDAGICAAVHRRNQAQPQGLVRRIVERFGEDLSGRRFVIWGLAFKPNTDDVREAPALVIVEELLKRGAAVAVHDPRALDAARRVLGERVRYCTDAYEPLGGSDALVTATEWMEYRSPDFDRLRAELKQPVIFDGRNIYDPAMMKRNDFEYYSVGRPPLLRGV